MSRVLRLNAGGLPTNWISFEEAAVLYCKEQVLWEAGENKIRLHGGHNRCGVQSVIDLSPVIATHGRGKSLSPTAFNNAMLFRRDEYRCLYCGHQFTYRELTRDHVLPRAQGGDHSWTNLVAACKRCNHAKGNRTPEEAGMPLLAIPFAPNPFEAMFLSHHKILGDQMEYLKQQFTGRRQWAA